MNRIPMPLPAACTFLPPAELRLLHDAGGRLGGAAGLAVQLATLVPLTVENIECARLEDLDFATGVVEVWSVHGEEAEIVLGRHALQIVRQATAGRRTGLLIRDSRTIGPVVDGGDPSTKARLDAALAAIDPRTASIEWTFARLAHNIECIEIGEKLGARNLTVWVGDGTNFPGQQDFARSLDRYLEAAAEVYAALPGGWRMLLEHKMFEPAFYSSVISDWGSSILAAQALGDKCRCLVDLGHHAPNVNIEQIVARLHAFGKLGGFHFNDSKYGDDDLDSGSINPHQLFLVFNELVEAELNPRNGFDPAYMIDQSHNVTDPIESMLSSAEAIGGAYAKALLVDREQLAAAQEGNDTMMAFQALRRAYRVDVSPILAMARVEKGGAIDVLAAYRASGWRARKAQERRAVGLGAGII